MNEEQTPPGEVRIADILAPLAGRGRKIRNITIITLFVVLVAALILFFVQPVRRLISVGFRPMFAGADNGEYPNGVPFAPADIVDRSILAQVYDTNEIKSYCSLEQFSSGFTVHVRSPNIRLLDLEYQARLSDSRLTAVERQQLQDEYITRRRSIPAEYELQFLRWRDCIRIPSPVAFKVVTDTLETWARDATEKRGVTRVRVAVLTPSLIAEASRSGNNLLVRADMLRRAVRRIIQNLQHVETIPGAELVRGSDRNISFLEVRIELEDLVQARLDPLVLRAGRLVGAEGQNWVSQALETATIEHKAASNRADAYLSALREYSGNARSPASSEQLAPQRNSVDVQGITPQIDRTFIDRIVEMAEVNTTFRQELTRELIEASVQAVERQATMEEYQQLASPSRSPAAGISEADLSQDLANLAKEAAEATKRFNEIFDQFSATTLRPGSTMYQVETSASETTIRSLGLRGIGLALLATALLLPLVVAGFVVVLFHLRRMMPRRI